MARPKEFNRTEALERAMHVFWQHGYEGSSIQTLLTEMGINRGSLYDTFGDKQSLFLAALDHYREFIIGSHLERLRSSSCGLDDLREFLQLLVEQVVSGETTFGCFVWNALVELGPHCEKTRTLVDACVGDLENCFLEVLTRAKGQGELDSVYAPEELAALLVHFIGGVSACGKSPRASEKADRSLRVILGLLNKTVAH